jgi:hypothetical protein
MRLASRLEELNRLSLKKVAVPPEQATAPQVGAAAAKAKVCDELVDLVRK